MYSKILKVIIPGAEEEYYLNVEVTPGDSVASLKDRVPEIRDMCLFRSHNSLPIKETTDLHKTVKDGDRLIAASYQDVGAIRIQ